MAFRVRKIKRKKYVPKHSKSETRRVESKNAILEMLEKGVAFIEIQIAHNAHIDPKTRDIKRLAQLQGINVRIVMRNIIDRQSETTSTESVVGILPKHEHKSLKAILEETHDQKNRTFLLLDGIEYSQNLGGILRTALAAAVTAVVIPVSKGAEINPEVTRISMGASEIVPIVYMSIYSAVETLKEDGFRIVGVDMQGQKSYSGINLWGDTAFLFGSEAKGSTDQMLEECDDVVRIPMKGDIGSLNVGVSVGIVLFEKIRQEK
jgi:23S rRNA (guanosine2251-2'-O)-methyltransferase